MFQHLNTLRAATKRHANVSVIQHSCWVRSKSKDHGRSVHRLDHFVELVPWAQDNTLPDNAKVKPQHKLGLKMGKATHVPCEDMGAIHILQYLSQNSCIWGIPAFVQLLGVSPDATDGEKKQIKDIVKQEQNRDRVNSYAKQKPPRTCMEVTKHSQSNTRKWRHVLKKWKRIH